MRLIADEEFCIYIVPLFLQKFLVIYLYYSLCKEANASQMYFILFLSFVLYERDFLCIERKLQTQPAH